MQWTSHLKTQQDKDRFKQLLNSSKEVLERLSDILQSEFDSIDTVKETDYFNASWAYLQAHQNGRKEQLIKILTILNKTLDNK